MKEKFETIPGCHIVPGRIVHCTRCGSEYLSTSLVYGRKLGKHDRRTGDTVAGWSWFCANDACYGKSPQDIYPVTVEST